MIRTGDTMSAVTVDRLEVAESYFFMRNPDRNGKRFRVDVRENRATGQMWFVQDASQNEYGETGRSGWEVTSTGNPEPRRTETKNEALAIVAVEMVLGEPERKPQEVIVWRGWDGQQ